MANPQPDKYTKISNEIIEALARIRIPGEAMQVLWVVFRKTYGWNKKSDHISMSQISEMTGLKRPTVARAMKRLLDCGVIKKDNSVIKNVNTPVIQNDNIGVIKNDTHKRKVKDISTKEKRVVKFNFEEIWGKYPKMVKRKEAERHFNATVKTEEDWFNINKALKTYIASKDVRGGYIQNGSTWFNNWQDWIDYEEYDPRDRYHEPPIKREEKEMIPGEDY